MSVSTTAISSKPLFGGKQSQRNQYVKDAVLTSQDISRHDFFWLVQRRSMAWRGVLKGTPATAMFQDKRWQQPTYHYNIYIIFFGHTLLKLRVCVATRQLSMMYLKHIANFPRHPSRQDCMHTHIYCFVHLLPTLKIA